MRKVISVIGITLFLAFIVIGCSSKASSNDDEVITLKMAYPQAPSHLISENGSQYFMDRVEELTDGQVEFVDYPSGQIGKAEDYLELIDTGVIDIGYFASSYFPSNMPLTSGLGGLPGHYETAQQGSKAMYEVSQQEPILSTDFLDNGVRPLTIMTPPTYEIFSKDQPLKAPEDLKGLKVRGAGGTMDASLQYVKASPTSIPAPDLYESFERGTVDVLFFSYSSMSGYNLQEVANYGTRGVGFGSTPLGYMMSEDVFQDLPEDIQEALVQAGEETTDSIAEAMQEAEKSYSEEWESDGELEIYNLTSEEQEVWKNAVNGFDEEWAEKSEEKGYESFESLDLYKEALEKYKE